jgi:ATP-dependent helicase/nuclease subunit A
MLLSDHSIRTAFSAEFNKNFSILAPAGVGKTHAIVERIVNWIKKHSSTIDANPVRLLVVTYTKKAAQEMAERVRLAFEKQAASLQQIQALDQHFFGTIHSFCYELVCEHRLQLGLPSELNLCEDDYPYWLQFVRSGHYTDFMQRHGQFHSLLRFVSVLDVYNLLESCDHLPEDSCAKDIIEKPMPDLDFDKILNYGPENKRVEKGQEREKEKLRGWISLLKSDFPLEIPDASSGGDAFKETWLSLFRPLRDWVGVMLKEFAACIAREFKKYRLQQGLVTYQDMIALAQQLMSDGKILQKLRERHYSVILDEAQDCDRTQFSILLSLASPATSSGIWPLSEQAAEPGPGRFCMVGDPQQSIYSDRADLKTYRQIHHAFSGSHNGVAGAFHVTFRCDRGILDFTNAVFPNVLKTRYIEVAQADYVTMEARPNAESGQVLRLLMQQPDEALMDPKLADLEKLEAEWLAQWLKQMSPEALRIRDWSECAILAPRNEWLKPLAKALEAANVPYQVRSKHRMVGDNPAYAWLAALMTIIVEPTNAYEINSVLREVFGIKDSDVALYVEESKRRASECHLHPLQITDPEMVLVLDSEVGRVLMQLCSVRAQILMMGLREGVECVVSKMQLRQRLSLLQPYFTDDFEVAVSSLLSVASKFEKETKTLLEFVGHLQSQYWQPTEDEKILTGKIQLLTCHSAKGLQWDAVIVPFLFRSISFKDLPYPRLVWPKESRLSPVLALDAQHKYPEHALMQYRMQKQELERLLYVAVTRAKHSLVLVDDRCLFASCESSFADLLQVLPDQANAGYFSSLATKPSADAKTLSNFKPSSGVVSVVQKVHALSSETYQRALVNTKAFPVRVTPSGLVHATKILANAEDEIDLDAIGSSQEDVDVISPEVNLSARSKNSYYTGTDYGTWWHEALEHAPLNGDVNALRNYLAESLATSPDPERAKAEFRLLVSSELCTRLLQPNTYLRSELPILGKSGTTYVYEGFVDLLAYLPQEDTWLIIDWKTDQVHDKNALVALAKTYSSQLLAYTTVLAPLLKGKIETLIYSTRLGQTINCSGVNITKNP